MQKTDKKCKAYTYKLKEKTMVDASELKRQYRISLVAFLSAGVLASLSTGYIYFTTIMSQSL